MRRFVDLFGGAFSFICLLTVLVSARSRNIRPMLEWQPSLLPQRGIMSSLWSPTLAPRPQVPGGESERRPDTSTVRVTCHPDYMHIETNADLLELGFPVNVKDVRLGVSKQTGDACRALPSKPGKYTIAALLTDCGTRHLITDDYLIYTNTLEYSPGPSPDGLIRTQAASFPIECRYKRRFDLSSMPVMPTWVPFMSTRADKGQLDFSLRLMTDDWAFSRAAKTYYLGELIHIEASVTQFNHNPMRVFVVDCVATVTPDANSVPRYAFIEQGCLMDSYMTGSTSSFLPRKQHDKLQLQLDAFRFHQEERAELYITCMLKAQPVGEADGTGLACTFMDNRWQSADSEDQLCKACLSVDHGRSPPFNHESPPVIQNLAGSHGNSSSSQGLSQFAFMKPRSKRPSPESPEPSKGWEKEERIGPISVLKKSNSLLAPTEAFQGIPQLVPETEMANPFKAAPEGYSMDGHPNELDKPDLAEMMELLIKASLPVTNEENATEASMTEATSLPVDEEAVPIPTVLDNETLFASTSLAKEDKMADLKLDVALETPSNSSAPSKEDVVTLGNKEEDGMRR